MSVDGRTRGREHTERAAARRPCDFTRRRCLSLPAALLSPPLSPLLLPCSGCACGGPARARGGWSGRPRRRGRRGLMERRERRGVRGGVREVGKLDGWKKERAVGGWGTHLGALATPGPSQRGGCGCWVSGRARPVAGGGRSRETAPATRPFNWLGPAGPTKKATRNSLSSLTHPRGRPPAPGRPAGTRPGRTSCPAERPAWRSGGVRGVCGAVGGRREDGLGETGEWRVSARVRAWLDVSIFSSQGVGRGRSVTHAPHPHTHTLRTHSTALSLLLPIGACAAACWARWPAA